MFSGIIEEVGTVRAVRALENAREVTIAAEGVAADLRPGASVAVDGACLTVLRTLEGAFVVETVETTLSRTVAGTYGPGTRVNLERALAVGGRLDGHLVQGHVDGVGEVLSVQRRGDHRLLDIDMPRPVADVTVLHGSIAVNGVSLTVNELHDDDRFQVAIIPYTWTHTALSDRRPGDPVNLEGDLIGKYVGRIVARRGAGASAAGGTVVAPPPDRGSEHAL